MTLAEQVVAWLTQQDPAIYLVGGCVRDMLLNREVHDLDLAVEGSGLELACRLADHFSGDFYPLDEARDVGRAILYERQHRVLVADAARLRGVDLRADLTARDFTINALAANVREPDTLIDPHGGLADLQGRVIRVVSEHSIRDDPVRALRAVRQAAELDMALAPETRAAILRDGEGLQFVSGERVRDELCRLLAIPESMPALTTLDQMCLLTLVFPELEPLRDLPQPPPHQLTGLEHTLVTVGQLEKLLRAMAGASSAEKAPVGAQPVDQRHLEETACALTSEDWRRLMVRFADGLRERMQQPLGHTRSRMVALKLAALFHDSGKPACRSIDEHNKIRFIGHPNAGARIVHAALRRLRLSNAEVQYAETVVRHHMRPLLLAKQARTSARAIYRFFRDTGDAGVDVLLHALADHQAAQHPGAAEVGASSLLRLAERMWADYFCHHAERVLPPAIVNGRDLLEAFALTPGPLVGNLLEAIREAQVAGQLSTREEALQLARALIEGGNPGRNRSRGPGRSEGERETSIPS